MQYLPFQSFIYIHTLRVSDRTGRYSKQRSHDQFILHMAIPVQEPVKKTCLYSAHT